MVIIKTVINRNVTTETNNAHVSITKTNKLSTYCRSAYQHSIGPDNQIYFRYILVKIHIKQSQ